MFKNIRYWLKKTPWTQAELDMAQMAFEWGCWHLNLDRSKIEVNLEVRKKLKLFGLCTHFCDEIEIDVFKSTQPIGTLLHELAHAEQYLNDKMFSISSNERIRIWKGVKCKNEVVEEYAYAMEKVLLIRFNQYMKSAGYEGDEIV